MQVILQETVKNLGMIGDVVDVAAGYYRNFLGPRHLALTANPKSIKMLEHQKKLIEAKKSKAKAGVLEVGKKLSSIALNIMHSAGTGEKLFGSITTQEIAMVIAEQGFVVDRKFIILEAPIKTIGTHVIKVKLHPEVIVDVKLNVVAKNKPQKDNEEDHG